MDEWLFLLIGFVAGGALGAAGVAVPLLIARGRLRSELDQTRTRAETHEEALTTRLGERTEEAVALRQSLAESEARREDAERQLAAQCERTRTLEQAEQRLREAFMATGAEALQANSKQFLEIARTRLESLFVEARGDAEKRQVAIDATVKPIRELLNKHAEAVTEIERKRDVAYKGLEQQIAHIITSNEKLDRETSRLVTALRRPEQRGRWGEMQLRSVVEMAGMTKHCDFREQPQTDDPTTRDRPDLVVDMPGGGVIVVDAKVALDAYLDALQPDADRDVLMKRHADLVDKHVRSLASKRYWAQFEHAPKLVVMFMPVESALLAALEVRPTLHADAMHANVLIATPTLLVATLRAVAYGWQQESIARNAREIASVGSELYDRLATFVEHFETIGARLSKTTEAYNKTVGSLETRVLSSSRKLRDLHATARAEVELPASVEIESRAISSAELKPLPGAQLPLAETDDGANEEPEPEPEATTGAQTQT